MERILVGTSPRQGAFSALTRAISLAKRIRATVHVLFVSPPPARECADAPQLAAPDDCRRLRLMVQKAQEEGIRFARDRKITLLVLEGTEGEGRTLEQDSLSLKRILHGISCRIEVVSPRRSEAATQGKGSAT